MTAGSRHMPHLARRLAMALRREPPNPHDEAWASTVLSAAELALFRRHRPDDRRHALAVARTV